MAFTTIASSAPVAAPVNQEHNPSFPLPTNCVVARTAVGNVLVDSEHNLSFPLPTNCVVA